MHSFELYMPTRLVYGADSIEKLAAAAAPYGKRADHLRWRQRGSQRPARARQEGAVRF